MSSNTASKAQSLSIMSLPREVRHQILRHTPLVSWNREEYRSKDLLIAKHHCYRKKEFKLYDYLRPFARGLADIDNEAFRDDVYYVLFSSNELVMEGHPLESLDFLKLARPYLQYVRSLKFRFWFLQIDWWVTGAERRVEVPSLEDDRPAHVSQWDDGLFETCGIWLRGSGEEPPLDQNWLKLVDFIKANLDLTKLTLTLDGLTNCSRAWFQVDKYWQTAPAYWPAICQNIVQPFEGWGSKEGLKDFESYWLVEGFEDVAWQTVMLDANERLDASDAFPNISPGQ